MDNLTRQRIQDWSFDVTIGSGMAEEWAEIGYKPGEGEFTRLSSVLGHPLTKEEIDWLLTCWKTNLQEAASP